MATITKRGNKYFVQVRRQGYPAQRKSFSHKKDAETWAKQVELQIERAELPSDPRKQLNGMTLRQLVEKYRDEVSPRKKSGSNEQIVLNAFLRDDIVKKTVADLTVKDFVKYKDKRLETVSPQTLKRQLNIISNVFKVAKSEWSLPIKSNPVTELGFTAKLVKRDRLPEEDELFLIIEAAKRRRNPYIALIIQFGSETGMRLGEIVNAKWKHLDLKSRTLLVAETKTDTPRVIPLSRKATEILEGLACEDRPLSEAIFPVTAANLKVTWKRILQEVGIEDLHFHDLRHYCITGLFDRGLHIGEVALISGHADWKSLKIYTNPKPSNIVAKLDASEVAR